MKLYKQAGKLTRDELASANRKKRSAFAVEEEKLHELFKARRAKALK